MLMGCSKQNSRELLHRDALGLQVLLLLQQGQVLEILGSPAMHRILAQHSRKQAQSELVGTDCMGLWASNPLRAVGGLNLSCNWCWQGGWQCAGQSTVKQAEVSNSLSSRLWKLAVGQQRLRRLSQLMRVKQAKRGPPT